MSGGTSAGNIVTEAPATYAARTWIDITKADAFGVISDAQLGDIVAANWFNNVDDALITLNAWLAGTGTASHIRATTATLGTCNFTTLAAATAMIGTGALTDAPSSADDVAIGNLAGTDRGLSILSTSVGRLAFVDTAATLTGYLAYTHATDTLALGVAGATELNLTSAALAPHADGGLTLGTASLRFAEAHTSDLFVYDDLTVSDAATVQTSVTIGDATASPSLALNRDTAGTGDLLFRSESVSRWRLRHKADGNLSLDRLDGSGVLEDSVLMDATTGAWTLPGATTTFSNTNAAVTIGDGGGNTYLILDGSTGYLAYREAGVVQFDINYDGNGLNFNRYAAGVFADQVVINGSTGQMSVPHTLVVGGNSTASSILAVNKDETGAASVGWRNEGTARWAFILDSSEDLLLRRYDSGGSTLGTCTFTNSSGLWYLSNDVTLTGATRVLTIGDNSGAASLVISKSDATAGNLDYTSNAVVRWRWACNSSENLILERYSSGAALQDTLTVSTSNGEWSFPAPIGISGSASRFRAGTGAPGAGVGSNGDLYWRTDGGASTCLYYKVGGSWSALAT